MPTPLRFLAILTTTLAATIFAMPSVVSADTVQITTLTKPGGVMANIAFNVSEGMAFTTDNSAYVLNQISVSLTTTTSPGYTGRLQGDLYIADSLGRPFGPSLGTLLTSDTIGNPFSPINFIPTSPVILSANTQYAFALSTTSDATRSWALEFTPVSGGYDLPNGGNWSMYPGRSYWVDGTWYSDGFYRARAAVTATPIATKGGNHFGQQLHGKPDALSLPASLGGAFSSAVAINQRGQILLSAITASYGAPHAFVVTQGTAQDVGDLGGDFANGTVINKKGQVAGNSNTTAGDWHAHAFLSSDGVIKDLNISPDLPNAAVYGLNDDGAVVGYFASPDWSRFVSFLYSNGTTKLIGDFGGNFSFAQGINSKGAVVGVATEPGDTRSHAYLYVDGVTVDLGGLGGSNSSAAAINSKGQIAGSSTIAGDQSSHPFLIDQGIMRDLGLPLGSSNGYPTALNEKGDVIGTLTAANGSQVHTFLYTNGVIKDLGTPADWAHSYPLGINESGDVVGYLISSDWSQYSAYLYSNGVLKELNIAYSNLLSDGTKAGFISLSFAYGIDKNGLVVGQGNYSDGMNLFSAQAFVLDTKAHVLKKLK